MVLLAVTIPADANAQASFKIVDSRDNCIELSGTSTFQDWTMATLVIYGSATFITEPGYYITGLKEMEFSIPVTKLKSGKKELDKNAYKALKEKHFRTVDYKLASAKITGEKDYKYLITTTGNLTIAGVTKQVIIDMACTPNKNGSITCEGTYSIKMTDYNIEPPNFFDGLMSTSESVAINFSMRFER